MRSNRSSASLTFMYVTISVNFKSVLCDIDAHSIASTHHHNVRPAHRALQGKSCCGAVSIFSHDADIDPSIVPFTLWQRNRRLASQVVYQRVSSERFLDGNLTCGCSDLRVLTSLAILSTATDERLSSQREEVVVRRVSRILISLKLLFEEQRLGIRGRRWLSKVTSLLSLLSWLDGDRRQTSKRDLTWR